MTEIRRTPEVLYAVVQPPETIARWAAERGLAVPWHITIATAPGVRPVAAMYAAQNQEGEAVSAPGFTLPLAIPYRAGSWDDGAQAVVPG